VIRGITVAAGLLALGAQASTLAAGSPRDLLLTHSLAVILIAIAVYSWLIFPLVAAVAVSGVVLGVTLWAWGATSSGILGFDALALGALLLITALQQRRRRRRLMQLRQTVSDLDEELYVKQQARRLAEQSHEVLKHKVARYLQLQTIAEQLSRSVNLEEICQLAVDRTFELIGKSNVCLLFLVDPARQELALYASKRAADIPAIRSKQGDHFDHYVLRTQRPLLVNDVRRDFRFSVAATVERPVGSVIACPVRVAQRAEGVLRLDGSQPGGYTQDDLRFLDILLGLVDTAIANARVFAQTQQLAVTDGLTGLYRRQPFMDQLVREVARASRASEPFSVLMIDIDDFKRFNDTYGHSAGDVVLKGVADIVRSSIPLDALPARYGGEEFAVVLPKMSREAGAELAMRIRDLTAEGVQALGQGPGRQVTVSIGVAAFPEDAQSELELIRRADARLYQAKRSGKNRVWAS